MMQRNLFLAVHCGTGDDLVNGVGKVCKKRDGRRDLATKNKLPESAVAQQKTRQEGRNAEKFFGASISHVRASILMSAISQIVAAISFCRSLRIVVKLTRRVVFVQAMLGAARSEIPNYYPFSGGRIMQAGCGSPRLIRDTR
jgi:hypothetical protein